MPDAVIRPFDNWRGLSKGYISRPEVLPPDTRAIRFSGRMSSVELANVIKAASNRITPEMLDGAPTFEAIAASLLQVMEGAVLVAHNAPFDPGFLAAELEIARLPLSPTLAVDTLALVRRAYRFARNSLPAVADALGVDVGRAHRAMGDVQTTRRVLERRRGITTLGQLLEFQGGSVPYPHSPVLSLPPSIAEAIANGGRVRMRYVDARGRETERVVSPLRVHAQQGNLYLVAHCYRRDAQRTFRLDRVVDMVPEA